MRHYVVLERRLLSVTRIDFIYDRYEGAKRKSFPQGAASGLFGVVCRKSKAVIWHEVQLYEFGPQRTLLPFAAAPLLPEECQKRTIESGSGEGCKFRLKFRYSTEDLLSVAALHEVGRPSLEDGAGRAF